MKQIEQLKIGGTIVNLGVVQVNIIPMIGETEATKAFLCVEFMRFMLQAGQAGYAVHLSENEDECIIFTVTNASGQGVEFSLRDLSELVLTCDGLVDKLRGMFGPPLREKEC